jgi:drug/metabolite transporter (DMT)-like permease
MQQWNDSMAAQPPSAQQNVMRGIGLYALALMSFTVLDASAKWLGQSMHPLQVVWFRYAVSVVLVMAVINPLTKPGVLRTRRPLLQGVRSCLLLASTALNFFALQHLQLAETTTLVFATPLVIALLAGPLLGEWVGPRRMAAIIVGFLGVLVVMRPGLGGLHPAALYVVAGVICYAFYNILTRQLAAHDSSQTTMVYSGAAGFALMTPVLPLVWTPPAGALDWSLLALTGLAGAVGHWLVIGAHRIAPASTLAPFIYSQLIWMLAAGWLIFAQLPDRWTLAGGLIVIASGLYLLYRERVKGVETKRFSE